MQLDRFILRNSHLSQRQIRRLIVDGRVLVNGVIQKNTLHGVNAFTHIQINNVVLQANTPRYFMLNKPAGVVSATCHPQHKTVVDLFPDYVRKELHLAGRLDFNTTGLMLLTNDGLWSKNLTRPERKIPKTYWLRTEKPITNDYVALFAKGMYFSYEGINIQPAQLILLTATTARLTIHEGRYHQIKRMFGHFNNKVTQLHRESIGAIYLDTQLGAGEYRVLSNVEIALPAH